MKTLIVMSALPGSGKSYWAQKYHEKHDNTFILAIDEIRFEVTNSYSDFSKQKKVWRIFNRRLKKLMKANNSTIIVDALNDTNIERLKYIKKFSKFDKYILVYLEKDKDELEYYNKQRPIYRWVPLDSLRKLYSRFEPLSNEVKEAYDEVIEITDYESL